MANETWFTKCTIGSIVGPPFRTHEMDLHALCPFQWYFYQFLFIWDGDNGIDRDTIPVYFKQGHWRFGKLPHRLSYIYPSSATNSKLQSVINNLPDRQKDLAKFSTQTVLEEELRKILPSPYELAQLESTFIDEWGLVNQERRDNIKNRQWSWKEGNLPVELLGNNGFSASIVLPPHRIDTLQFNKLFIIAYVNFSSQVMSRNSKILYSRENGTLEDATDPLTDYRIPVLLTYYLTQHNVAAATYIELFNGKRLGYYNEGDLPKHKGRQGYQQELRDAAYFQ